MRELLIFTVVESFAGTFKIDFYANDIVTGERITISGLHEDSLKGKTFGSNDYGTHVFKTGETGIVTYDSVFLDEFDINIVPIANVVKWDTNVDVTTEDGRLYYTKDGCTVLPCNELADTKTLVVERLPKVISYMGKDVALTNICYKVDNDVIRVFKKDINVTNNDEERNASAMRDRANRLVGIFDK